MVTHTESPNPPNGLTAMVHELETHQVILDGLETCYGMFLFTGGDVPKRSWGLAATTSYLARPFAAERISTSDVQRYRDLVQAVMALGETAALATPRSLRCRKDIADTFHGASAEMRELGSALVSVMTRAGVGRGPAPTFSGNRARRSDSDSVTARQ
jgi:hypothetical protein